MRSDFSLNFFTSPNSYGGCSEGLDAFRFFFRLLYLTEFLCIVSVGHDNVCVCVCIY